MMANVGLTSVVKTLLEKALPEDLTIKVDKEEFRVHREVMSSVSDYFRAMFSQGMVESEKDVIELKDISPDTMSKLITLIYTGDLEVLKTDGQEILALAVYFQMLPVIEVCTQKLIDNATIENCLELLSGFGRFALDDAVEHLHVFLKRNLTEVIEHYDKAKISFKVMQTFLDLWEGAEWDACMLVKDWVCVDSENRKQYLNDLMRQVRFCLMSKGKLKAVKQMEIYADPAGESPWQELVEKAVKYQKLPIHLKVLDESEQSRVRGNASPVFFTTGNLEHPATFYALNEENMWKVYEKKARYTPNFNPVPWDRVAVVAVNNFLVVCNSPTENDWHIFNPRTLAWSSIDSLDEPKQSFSLSHHGQYVYCVGGCHEDHLGGQDIPSDKTERYSLQTNTWTSIDAPTEFYSPAICVVGDSMYVCGSEEMWALDCVSLQWVRKASPSGRPQRATLHPLRFHNDDGLVLLTPCWEIDFYSLSLDQWSLVHYFKFKKAFDCIDAGNECMEMTSGNTIYRLNVIGRKDTGPRSVLPADAPMYLPGTCVIWKFSEDGDDAVEEEIDEFPIFCEDWMGRNIDPFGAMLAIPKDR